MLCERDILNKLNKPKINLFWFRRDLRLNDNAGLYHALKSKNPVLCIFIFDTDILDKLQNKEDKRVGFIHSALENLNQKIIEKGSSLLTLHGKPTEVFKQLCQDFQIEEVFTNHDYEPAAIQRDKEVSIFLSVQEISFTTFKDQVIFEKSEVTKDDGLPYTVFTPYSKKWKSKLNDFNLLSYSNEKYFHNLHKIKSVQILSLNEIGFKITNSINQTPIIQDGIIKQYDETRDFPAMNGTSKLSVHLRFGTVSIRELVRKAFKLNEVWLNELIWREFYMMILFHFPYVEKSAFKPAYDRIPWRNNEKEFKAWCEGKTGYPIVDAGMRELNETGFMHNRVRMITASFLVKHLLIDWRWGEAYFAKKLLDFDLAANNGGWQWAASSGCDAVPYFRIFNPSEQTRRFDNSFHYIRKWVPEFEDFHYPKPIVEHTFARNRAIETFKTILTT